MQILEVVWEKKFPHRFAKTYSATAQTGVMLGTIRDLINIDVIVPGAQSKQLAVRREFHDL